MTATSFAAAGHANPAIISSWLNLTEQQQDQEDNEDQTDKAGWPIAPASAMAPSRNDAE